MRNALTKLGIPAHIGLAYSSWAPVGAGDGKLLEERREQWLTQLSEMKISADYIHSFERWKESFASVGDRFTEFTLESRLLIGHGNSSATDIGLTVHHTWGVPIIPGSSLKGLVAHYVDATYGPENIEKPPWEQEGEEGERAKFQGITWSDGRILRGPGEIFRALFGAPDAEEDELMRQHDLEAGARAGLVTFHDALYIPGGSTGDMPFALDVLTVHQKDYYDEQGKVLPSDYDDPNPVPFLTVRPGSQFLLTISGPSDWTELAGQLLTDALHNWGIGGKTAAGYGRGSVNRWRHVELPASSVFDEFEEWLEANEKAKQREKLAALEEKWLPKLMGFSAHEKEEAGKLIRRAVKNRKLADQRDKLIAAFSEE